jgi:hypothetical protein
MILKEDLSSRNYWGLDNWMVFLEAIFSLNKLHVETSGIPNASNLDWYNNTINHY